MTTQIALILLGCLTAFGVIVGLWAAAAHAFATACINAASEDADAADWGGEQFHNGDVSI